MSELQRRTRDSVAGFVRRSPFRNIGRDRCSVVRTDRGYDVDRSSSMGHRQVIWLSSGIPNQYRPGSSTVTMSS